MAIEFKLPDLGENIESADVLNVLVKAGDELKKDQGILEIETDKATIEVPSTVEGKIENVMVKAGDKIKVGQVILTVGGAGEQSPAPEEKPAGAKAEPKQETPQQKAEEKQIDTEKEQAPVETVNKGEAGVLEFILPDLGENIESADILNVLVKPGDEIKKDQGLLEIETDKATIEVPSTIEGKVLEVFVKAGTKAKVGDLILKVESTTGAAEKEETPKPAAPPAEKKEEVKQEKKEDAAKPAGSGEAKGERHEFKGGEIDNQPPVLKNAAPAAPSVRRIAREIGIDINKVPGSGKDGRISMDDVKAYAKRINEARDAAPQTGSSFGIKAEALPDFTKFGQVERKPMSNVRAKTAEHLGYAWAVIPHVTQHDKADITEIEKLRKQYGARVEKSGGKLTVTSVLIKIAAAALKVFPQFNTSIDMEKKEVIYKQYCNIGVAVDTDRGLIVPVIKDADKKNLSEISVEMNMIAEKARLRKTSLEDMQGGCFTITNLGGIGGTSFTPIVNSPEVAILGVSRGSMEPVYNKETGQFEPRMMVPLSLSYDHRIIDGADAARFLRWICEVIEQPMRLWLEG